MQSSRSANEYLETIQIAVWNVNEKNFNESVESIMNLIDNNYPYSFYLLLSQIIFSSFASRAKSSDTCLRFVKAIETREANNKMFEIFTHYLLGLSSQESFYLLSEMIEQNLIDPKTVRNIESFYFAPYKTNHEIDWKSSFPLSIQLNFNELSKDNWSLHKKYVHEGVNHLEIAKIIRNDDIQKLQEISSKADFDFNQGVVPSLYEIFSFINKRNISLIDYAAFFGSIKCFKFLMLNGSDLKNTGKYAIAGGNLEIIHLCEQNDSSFEESYEAAVEFHQNDVFHYLYENEIVEIGDLAELGRKCIIYNNFELLSFLEERGMKITENVIMDSARIGNLFLTKFFLQEYPLPNCILGLSTKSGNIELVKYILEQQGIDVNEKND